MKIMDKPLFSIITVCYNAADTIGRTLESVAAQTFQNYEHIIVDGASKDATAEIIVTAPGASRRKFRSEPDHGLYDAMNKGLGMACGTYLVFLNAGDKFHGTDALDRLAAAAQTAAGDAMKPGILYGQTDIVDDSGTYLRPRHLRAPENLTLADFGRGMLVCHQAFVPLRRIAPLYDTDYRFSADYEWCIRCLQHSRKNVLVDGTLVDYLDGGLTTANHRASLKERYRIMCYYYGTVPTILRHIGFIFRALRRKITKQTSQE